MATNGDFYLATSGDFSMATDKRPTVTKRLTTGVAQRPKVGRPQDVVRDTVSVDSAERI